MRMGTPGPEPCHVATASSKGPGKCRSSFGWSCVQITWDGIAEQGVSRFGGTPSNLCRRVAGRDTEQRADQNSAMDGNPGVIIVMSYNRKLDLSLLEIRIKRKAGCVSPGGQHAMPF